MTDHGWIFNVLIDLKRYAKLNGLDELELHLDKVCKIAQTETRSASEVDAESSLRNSSAWMN